MIDPRQRILITTLAALAVAIGVSLSVAGSQEASGRAALTARARAFLRSLKGGADGEGTGRPTDPSEFLLPADRGRVSNLAALRRLKDAFDNTNDEFLVAQVKLLGHGKAVTYSPVALDVSTWPRRTVEGLELRWVQDADDRWYLDPAGL